VVAEGGCSPAGHMARRMAADSQARRRSTAAGLGNRMPTGALISWPHATTPHAAEGETIQEFPPRPANILRKLGWPPQFLDMQPTCFGMLRLHVALFFRVLDEMREGTVSMPSSLGVVSGKVLGLVGPEIITAKR